MPKTKEYKSTTIPGATFTLYEVGRVLRHQTDMKMAEHRYKLSLLLQQYQAVARDPEGKEKLQQELSEEKLAEYLKQNPDGPSGSLLSEEEKSKILQLTLESDLVNESIRLEITRARLVGYSIPRDGFKHLKTADDLLNDGEAELFAIEVENAANADWSIEEKIRKNSESPISSEPPTGGEMSDTTVTDANRLPNTQPAVAA